MLKHRTLHSKIIVLFLLHPSYVIPSHLSRSVSSRIPFIALCCLCYCSILDCTYLSLFLGPLYVRIRFNCSCQLLIGDLNVTVIPSWGEVKSTCWTWFENVVLGEVRWGWRTPLLVSAQSFRNQFFFAHQDIGFRDRVRSSTWLLISFSKSPGTTLYALSYTHRSIAHQVMLLYHGLVRHCSCSFDTT